MSSVAELKKKFQQGKGGVLTPEQHAQALLQKKRDQEEAVKIARARAARYNLTVRSLELINAQQQSEQVREAQKKKEETMKQAQNYGRRVSIASKKTNYSVAAHQGNVAAALSHNRNPSVAKALIEKAAEQVDKEIKQDILDEEKEKALSAAALAAKQKKEEEEMQAQLKLEEENRKKFEAEEAKKAAELAAKDIAIVESVDAGTNFEMKTLVEALETGDENDINKAIVVEFLEGHAPEKLPEVDQMLAENKGKEAELMQDLAEQYADPAEEEVKAAVDVIVEVEASPQKAAEIRDASKEPEKEDETEEDPIVMATRLKAEEEEKVAAMDEAEKERYMAELAANASHNEDKDRMLKQQLNIYSSNKPLAMGRGRGKKAKAAKILGVESEYIVNGVNEGGEWEVNVESTASN